MVDAYDFEISSDDADDVDVFAAYKDVWDVLFGWYVSDICVDDIMIGKM